MIIVISEEVTNTLHKKMTERTRKSKRKLTTRMKKKKDELERRKLHTTVKFWKCIYKSRKMKIRKKMEFVFPTTDYTSIYTPRKPLPALPQPTPT